MDKIDEKVEFWRLVKKAADEVRSWPEWKQKATGVPTPSTVRRGGTVPGPETSGAPILVPGQSQR